jgi:DNA-binding NarL/FixJ family response regulator
MWGLALMPVAIGGGMVGCVGPRVLIVDDHEGFRKMARLLLARAGYDVVGEADDGASAISAARAMRPDVILLDIQLPDIDGFEVARALGPYGIDENIILVSRRDAADYGRRIRASGVLGFIAKADVSGTNIRSLLDERDQLVDKEN